MFNFLVAIVLYLPFQLALNPAEGVDLASIRVLILILFFCWLADGLKKKNIQIKNNLQTWLVVSFLFLNTFSIVAAKNTDWSMRKLLFLFSIFPIYFAASQLIASRERLFLIIKAIVSSGFLAAAIGIIQFISQFIFGTKAVFDFWAKFVSVPFLGSSFGEAVLKNPSWLVNISGKTYLRATSLFPDPHMFAFYLGLILPLACGLIFCAERKKRFYIFAAGVIFLADICTFSRGGYVGLFAGFVFAGIFFWSRINKKYKIGAGAILVLALAAMFVPSPISQRFLSSFDLKEGSNQGRMEMWKKAGEVILDKPVLGTGIGNYPLEVSATASYRDPIYAHNTYLDIAAETGIANAIIWIGLLLSSAIGFWKKSKQEPLFLFVLLSIIIFSAHSLFETAIYSPVVLALFLVIIGLGNFELLKTDDNS